MAALVVFCTVPTVVEAEKIAASLVADRLAACVNLLPRIHSRYRWKGTVESAEEVLMIIKTAAARYAALERRIKSLHSYEVPEIIALPIFRGSAAYLGWLAASVRPARKK